MPWLPSASIAINIFLLGSIDKYSFIRFGVWTVLLLIYYIFFGLHASYDTAKEYEGKDYTLTLKKTEEGNSPSTAPMSVAVDHKNGHANPST